MNAQINLTQNNIKLLENKLMSLANRLGEATDSGREIYIKQIEADIAKTQQQLKEEFELLDELTNVQ